MATMLCRSTVNVGRVISRTSLRSAVAVKSNVRQFSNEDTVTHTGQVWDKNDYRNARFIDKSKEVNMNFSINLVAEEPPIEVKARSVHCDGGGGALGHPKVYINLDQEGPHSCGYCGLRFIKAKSAH